jgi:hypothetical protein
LILDSLNSNKEFGRVNATGAIYTLDIIGNLFISGNSDGSIQVFDIDTLCN